MALALIIEAFPKGKTKDWRRTRYARPAQTFMSAIFIAAAVIFFINQ